MRDLALKSEGTSKEEIEYLKLGEEYWFGGIDLDGNVNFTWLDGTTILKNSNNWVYYLIKLYPLLQSPKKMGNRGTRFLRKVLKVKKVDMIYSILNLFSSKFSIEG